MNAKNPYGRSAIEQAEYERYFHPGPEPRTLINKLGITDFEELEKAERYLVAERLRQGLPPEACERTYDGFKAIHAHLFQDVYEWAGKERTYTTGRGPIAFAVPDFIAPFMERQFRNLENQRFLEGLSSEEFSKQAAILVNEINAAHPFIDGNGRTQRVWLRVLAEKADHDLTLKSSDTKRWNEASRVGFETSDERPMTDLLRHRLQDRKREQTRSR